MSKNTNFKQIAEVFRHFCILGCTSFGGPAAHLGYFRKYFVDEKKWIDAEGYSRLIALSQFLPGPGSSQVGFALGIHRAGIAGGISAFVGFTLPSFILLYLLALSSNFHSSSAVIEGITHGLKLLAVIVVADAILSMQKSFCAEKTTLFIAFITAVSLLLFPSITTQAITLVAAATYGILLHKTNKPTQISSASPAIHSGNRYLILFLILFITLPLFANHSTWINLAADFYHSGSLVFGGGHVVLPLLQQSLGGQLTEETLLLGYSAAQAVPGPMFTLATYLGAQIESEQMFLGATIATLAIFLPGLLLMAGLHERWETISQIPKLAGAVWGINAAVVGLLVAAFYQPVITSGITSMVDIILVCVGFYLLRKYSLPIIWLVVGFTFTGLLTVFV